MVRQSQQQDSSSLPLDGASVATAASENAYRLVAPLQKRPCVP
jgi:hypothetical protein